MDKVQLNLKVTHEQRHALDMAATGLDRSMAEIIREAVAAKLREIAPQHANSWEILAA